MLIDSTENLNENEQPKKQKSVVSHLRPSAPEMPSSIASSLEMLVGFYARRLKRLAPALVLVTVITGLLVALFVQPSPAVASYYESGMYALVGLSNNYFAWPKGNVRNAGLQHPILNTSAVCASQLSEHLSGHGGRRRLSNDYFAYMTN